ncbi:serine hydrolase [Candidatus Poribacteria bacterium]|nr:serine hydrolase [Candidatus Poribacteria bacterium]
MEKLKTSNKWIKYPEDEWEKVSPPDAGFDPQKLEKAKQWLDENVEKDYYRVVVIKDGQLVVEWDGNTDRDKKYAIASAAKSVYSNILGIVAAEGKIKSPDAKVYDYYPEMMDVPEGEGPKDGRYAFEKDRNITFRQLISNTSGYMKPGEEPGKVFHYQTYGMNILTHSLAKIYGYYDIDDPKGSEGFKKLITDKLASKVGINWDYSLSNFNLHEKARLNIFGYYCQIHTTALDLARLGWLWCNWGRWEDQQVIPEEWLRTSVQTNMDILLNCPKEEWKYGHGFWTNDNNELWPGLPRTGFTASGAGGQYVSVFPDSRLVIVQNPGVYVKDKDGNPERGNISLIRLILESAGVL